jgi:hypothetical protein
VGAGTTLAAFLLVLVIVFFFWTPLMNGITHVTGGTTPTSSDIQTLVQNALNSLKSFLGGASPAVNANASATIGFKIHFSDGTVQTINQDMSYSIYPLSITFQGKTVSSIEVDVLCKPTIEIQSWSTVVNVHCELYKKPYTTPATSSTGNYTNQGQTWSKGTIKTLAAVSITSQDIDQAASISGGDGDYWLGCTGSVTLYATINGLQYTFSSSSLGFYQNGIVAGLDITYAGGTTQGVTYSAVYPSPLQ